MPQEKYVLALLQPHKKSIDVMDTFTHSHPLNIALEHWINIHLLCDCGLAHFVRAWF